MSNAALPLVAALALTGSAFAQSALDDPLQTASPAFEAAMSEVLDGAGEGAHLLRCAGAFQAFVVYAGDGSELAELATERETDFAIFAGLIWRAETGGTDAESFEAIVPYIAGAADLYVQRMIDNHTANGSVFDDGLEARIGFCNLLHTRLMGDEAG